MQATSPLDTGPTTNKAIVSREHILLVDPPHSGIGLLTSQITGQWVSRCIKNVWMKAIV